MKNVKAENLVREQESYHHTNMEMINVWEKDLEEQFKSVFPNNINLLEKTKIIKSNMLYTLEMAKKLASLSKDKEIFDTSSSLQSIDKEMDKIRKDVVSIAVFGQMSSGKSSFLNSLVGDDLLIVAEERATATISVIRHIDNFDGRKDGDIVIHYKSENEIIFQVKNAIELLASHFPDFHSCELFTIDAILSKKDELLELLENSNIRGIKRAHRKIVKENKKILELILVSLEENIELLGTTPIKNIIDKSALINHEKSVFINNVIFYKDIDLLKNIELIDTPGLGSNSQLDTRKSEEFISRADIIMILTDAKEPMQNESEEDVLHILQDIQVEENDPNFFDKVFIVVNKIDDSTNSRKKITNLLQESLDEAEVEIKESHLLYISAKYEYLKRVNKRVLKGMHFNNRENIGKNDLEHIEKTIYNFSAAEATSKFIEWHLKQIDIIFDEAKRNFKENIEKLNDSIEETQKKIDKFKSNREKIQIELEETLNRMIMDEFRVLLAKSLNEIDLTLKQVSSEEYFNWRASEGKGFDKANNDNTSSYYYKRIAKELFTKIIDETNIYIEKILKQKVFHEANKKEIKKKLQDKTKKIQEKYENDYGVVLSLDEINIKTIKISLEKNIDLEISVFKSLILFLNPFMWGKTAKYVDISAECWEDYSKNRYKKSLYEDIKKQVNNSKDILQKEVTLSIKNIVSTIDAQLQQELRDKQHYTYNKDETMYRKTKIQDAFSKLKDKYINIAKAQNSQLFK